MSPSICRGNDGLATDGLGEGVVAEGLDETDEESGGKTTIRMDVVVENGKGVTERLGDLAGIRPR